MDKLSFDETINKLDLIVPEMKKKYKKEGYADFLPNTGTEKDLENMFLVIEKIIKNF